MNEDVSDVPADRIREGRDWTIEAEMHPENQGLPRDFLRHSNATPDARAIVMIVTMITDGPDELGGGGVESASIIKWLTAAATAATELFNDDSALATKIVFDQS
jgi:hypothetical protein